MQASEVNRVEYFSVPNNEHELPQGSRILLVDVFGRESCLPLHLPAIDASLISLLKPRDLAATRADIFVYKSDLWPGRPSRPRDINVIQRPVRGALT